MTQKGLFFPSLSFCCCHINWWQKQTNQPKVKTRNQANTSMNDNHFAWYLVSEIVTQEHYSGLSSLLSPNTKNLPYPVREGECGQRTFQVSWPWLVFKTLLESFCVIAQFFSLRYSTGLPKWNCCLKSFHEIKKGHDTPTKASPDHDLFPKTMT